MNKEQKIESILNSLEGMERSAPQPFFFTRLEARMQKSWESQWGIIEKIVGFLSKPAIAFATVMIIILINAYAIFTSPDNTPTNVTSTTDLTSVDEYVQLTSNFFDSEKSNP